MKDEENKNKKSDAALREEAVLKFWKENKIFEKSLNKKSPKGEFVFYEGPPTANGKPGIHHLEARAFKDAIPRYKTMQGYHVRRKGGWDTHGLPVELQVEKKLGLNSKKAIEEYGIAKFNQECKENVWEYVDLWNKFTERIGYWLDQENPYVTYHNTYIESVWSIVKKINEQNLLYKDYKVVPWCPRCGTALSSHELAQGYEEVKDLSLYALFPVVGQEKTFLLAWTTMAWTLPGNMALAVGADFTYAKVEHQGKYIWMVKDRINAVVPEGKIIEEKKGREIAGMAYEPVYAFVRDHARAKFPEAFAKAHKVYTDSHVTTEDGSGIVHTAVLYGQEDYEMGERLGLPKVHSVNPEGIFLPFTGFLAGRHAKDEETAVEIIKDLDSRGLLFKKEKYTHSYPHCWRCHTALIYYARDSWYIRMSDPEIKKELIDQNKKINWEPSHIQNGRFGEWLKDIKDWAISRERYWGTPLPVWLCKSCNKTEVIGSVVELKKRIKKSVNKYFFIRHGEAENNLLDIYSSDPAINHLTKKGKTEILNAAKRLTGKRIDFIYSSPFLRAKESAETLAESINFPKEKIIYDERIRELNFGDFSNSSATEFAQYMAKTDWKFDTKIINGESLQDAKNRFGEFLYELDRKYKDQSVLIVSHGIGVEVILAIIEAADKNQSLEINRLHFPQNTLGALYDFSNFVSLPRNENYELDLHRPYIDEVSLVCTCGGGLIRIKEVMDVWFDSGAMPFAQDHYPFDPEPKQAWYGAGNKRSQKFLYPADFISEGIDQTRGWFYTLHAIGVLMGRGLAYKNAICLGHLLDANGKKMSKSLGNVVDPWEMMDKYGVDTLRLWMYSVNQPGESKNFDEKTVQLLNQQVFGLLYNVLTFYELYRDKKLERNNWSKSENILDKWIVARMNNLIENTTEKLDNYKLLEPVRAMRDFINDLSTWYLRRSRERIKSGDEEAKKTFYYILKTLSKILAPFAPFVAEDIWLKLKNEDEKESVHLETWPSLVSIHPGAREWVNGLKIFPPMRLYDNSLVDDMEKCKIISTIVHELRQKVKLRVRQPLSKLCLFGSSFHTWTYKDSLIEILKNELNVKSIEDITKTSTGFIENKEGWITSKLYDRVWVSLDTRITPELQQEGNYRELLRAIQDIRKKLGLTPSDIILLTLETNEAGKQLIQKFDIDMKKIILASEIEFRENNGEEVKIDELVFRIKIRKA